MLVVNPSVILRLGSHSEKEYFEKILRFTDGFIIASNLIESTPGACASLVSRWSGEKMNNRYYIDPMTYTFGAYIDSTSNRVRKDLDWIKSDKVKGERTFKRSYVSLGEKLGTPFNDAINNNRAISPQSLTDQTILEEMCNNVCGYQLSRIKNIFEEDREFVDFASDIPNPSAVFAPYFYVAPEDETAWMDLNINLMKIAANQNLNVPVHGILCVDHSILLNEKFLKRIVNEIPQTGIDALWIWLSKLNEDEQINEKDKEEVTTTECYLKLKSLKELTKSLAKNVKVFNMHGGFFSLALCKFGMSGVSHGVGYGEQKDVVPVIGQAIPVVRYYLPDLRRRMGIAEIQRCFSSLNIDTPENFYKNICKCAICKGIVNSSIENFELFGELQVLKPGKKRRTQTPASAKRCRYHFLINRIEERKWLQSVSISELIKSLDTAYKKWGSFEVVRRSCTHLKVWSSVLMDNG